MRKPHSEPLSIGYLATVVVLMAILPLLSIVVARMTAQTINGDVWNLVFRWFVFWSVGMRLLMAGIRQVLQPSFTAREIFHLESLDAQVIVRELGLANVCLGLTAVVSGFVPSWRMAAAFGGALYFGIAGVLHVVKRPATPNEWVALASDLAIFLIVAGCFLHQLTTA